MELRGWPQDIRSLGTEKLFYFIFYYSHFNSEHSQGIWSKTEKEKGTDFLEQLQLWFS